MLVPRAALRPSSRLASVPPGLVVIAAHGNQLSPDAVLRLALLDRRGCPRWLHSLLWRGFPVRSPTSSVSWARRSRTATSAACIAVSVGDDGTNCTRCQLSILPPTCTTCLSMYLSNYICLLRKPSKGGWAGFFISSRLHAPRGPWCALCASCSSMSARRCTV